MCRVLPTLMQLALLVTLCMISLSVVPVTSATNTPNTWAVIVGSSRYLFNYRHTASALTMYHLLRQHGIDDDHILLFLADSFACDPRNAYPAEILSVTHTNLYGCSAQVDYAGDDVDVRRLLNVLQGRYDENTPPTRRLMSDENSNIIVYLSGHAAESYFKFHDSEFLSSTDIAETFAMMHKQRRYGRIVFLADTCHAISLCEHIQAPNVVCLAACDAASESYSFGNDRTMGLHLTSVWMYESLRLLEDTNCSDVRAGAMVGREGGKVPEKSILHRSWYDFNYAPERQLSYSFAPSIPAHRDAVNAPGAIKQWTVAEFLCAARPQISSIPVRHDLF